MRIEITTEKSASRVEVSAYGNIYGQSGDEHAGVTVHLVVKVGGCSCL